MAAERPSNVFHGCLMIVGAMSVIGLIDNFIRIIAEESGVWQFYLFRAAVSCTIVSVYLFYKRQRFLPQRFWAVALRSVLTAGAILIYFGSLTMMPIAEAGATLFSSPIFLLLFSALMFRTKIGPWRITAVAVGFAGVLLVLKPDPANLDVFSLLPLLAGMLYALGQLATRHLCADESTVVVLLWFFIATAIFGLIGMIALSVIRVPDDLILTAPFFFTEWVAPTGRFVFWTVVQGLGSLIAVSGLIRGYQIAEPTYITVFEYSFLVFAGFWGWVLWKEMPDAIGFIGIAAIIGAGIVITVRTQKRPAGNQPDPVN